MTAIGLAASVLSIAACTHTTDRVLEPAGQGDASVPSPEVSDAGLTPLTPIALPPEPVEDYRLVRAPEFGSGLAREISYRPSDDAAPASGGAGGANSGGMGGSDLRPALSSGGSHYY